MQNREGTYTQKSKEVYQKRVVELFDKLSKQNQDKIKEYIDRHKIAATSKSK